MLSGELKNAVLTFAIEPVEQAYEEAKELTKLHYDEIAKHKDVLQLDPNLAVYRKEEDNRRLACVTARHHGKIVGYFVWFLYQNPHYQGVLCAQEDIHYLLPEYRRGMAGYFLIKTAMKLVADLGVKYYIVREKVGHEHPALMKRLGFEPVDIVYSRKAE